MPDQDFNIKVVTTADTTGLRQTSAEFDEIKRKAAEASAAANKQAADAESKWASSPLNPKNAASGAGVGAAAGASSTVGSYIGIGTIVTLLTVAINKWKEFNAEQDRWVDGMIKANEKARELGESILDMQDKARNAARVGTEPLAVSFVRLQQEIIRLKTEQNLLDLPRQGEEWKKLAAQIATTEAQLKAVKSDLQNTSSAEQKAAQSELAKRVPGLAGQDPVKEADAQTQRILQNEQAAAQARAEGRDKDAEMFQKSADEYKASATPQQLADLQRIHELQDKLKPSAAPVGRPLTPEEFAAANYAGPGTTRDERAQNQLDNLAARYQSIQHTRQASQDATQDRELADFNQGLMQHGGKPVTKEEYRQIKTDQKLNDILRELEKQTSLWR